MKAGIVGLPNVGKSTLFNCLSNTKAQSANFPFCTIEPNIGIINVPDHRLTEIESYVNPEKVIPATVEIVDIAGLVKGASKGEGLGNQFLANIRETDAIIHVLRCFDDNNIVHVENTIDPVRDKEIIDLELQLKDLETLEKRKEKISRLIKTGNKEVLLFHCISSYPAELTDSRLGDIKYISDHFDVEVGLSDHTTSNIAAMLSVALGASAIEKHFKLDNTDCGPDSSFSILPEQLRSLCKECHAAYKATLSNKLERSTAEASSKIFRRSIYFVKDSS